LLNSPHNNETAQSTTARQAAEALFTPKLHRPTPSPVPENAAARKPRILAASAPVTPALLAPTQARAAIPKSQLDRVRTWLKYGMTMRQAADACGVPASELKDALRPPTR
jgi:hypothetical protein